MGLKDGITYLSDTAVTLCLFAPLKSEVYVIGEFNNWQKSPDYLMKHLPNENRFWLTIHNLEKGKEYAFQYLIDRNIAIGDPYCEKILDPWNDKYISNETYPTLKSYSKPTHKGLVSVLQTAQVPYEWKVKNFQKPAEKDLVIYELLIRDFVASGTYKEVMNSLEYIKNLGANAIELMPFTEFSGNDSWGYNPIYFTAPDKAYGTENDLKALIDKAHEMGMAVIQDIVFNHADYEFPYVKMYWDGKKPSKENPFFNQKAPHLYSVFYDFNHESGATQHFIDNVCEFWLTNYKVDGLRFDLSKGFTQKLTSTDAELAAYDASRIKILKRIYDKIRSYNQESYLILEHFADKQEETALANHGWMSWKNFNGDYRNIVKGLPVNFSEMYATISPKKIAYMESHDEERLLFDAMNPVTNSLKILSASVERAKLGAAFFLMIPGPKMIWQFGEFGYDVSINENGRVGKKPLKWEYLQDENRLKLFKTYQALLKLRNAIPFFNDAELTINENGEFKEIMLELPNEKIYLLGNFGLSTISQKANFPIIGSWYNYFLGNEINISSINAMIELEAGNFQLFTTKKYSL